MCAAPATCAVVRAPRSNFSAQEWAILCLHSVWIRIHECQLDYDEAPRRGQVPGPVTQLEANRSKVDIATRQSVRRAKVAVGHYLAVIDIDRDPGDAVPRAVEVERPIVRDRSVEVDLPN